MTRRIVLVKHAQPILEPTVAARYWALSREGEDQARRLARRLEQFMPFALACSCELKARRTGEIVAGELGVPMRIVDRLEEFDRPVLPLMPAAEYAQLNARIFDDLSTAVIGNESGAQALARFTAGIRKVLEGVPDTESLVVVTHGTVISLLVSAHNDVDPMDLWKRLKCPSFVVLTLPTFKLVGVVDQASD